MWRFFLLLVITFVVTLPVSAHQQRPSIVDITFNADAAIELTIETNIEARISGISPKHEDTDDSPHAEAYNALRLLSSEQLSEEVKTYANRYKNGFSLTVGDQKVPFVIDSYQIPEVGDPRLARLSKLVYRAELPNEGSSAIWHYSAEYGDSVVRFAVAGDENKISHWLKEGKASPAFAISEQVRPKSTMQVAVEYTVLGFEHILPKGLDHILFVLGLFLLSLAWRPLLWQVTAFTLAHTITLALTILGYISLPSSIVEPLIALSIAYVGIENLLVKRLTTWRPIIIFLFGLLHGMGFASVLVDLGLPESNFVTALLTFNLGVEIGQLAVILGAFALVFWLRDREETYRRYVVIPGSLIIALTGLYWTWERVWG